MSNCLKVIALLMFMFIQASVAQNQFPPPSGNGGTPGGAAGGKLSGTYPNPGVIAAICDVTGMTVGGVLIIAAGPICNGAATLPAANMPNPSATTLGGVESIAPLGNNWVDSISTSGVPHQSQPSFGALSGQATLPQIASQAADTVVMNATGSAASPTAVSVPNCVNNGGVLQYSTTTHSLSCHTLTGTDLPVITLSLLATQAADTLVANATGSSATPTAVAFPTSGTNGCAGISNALTYNTSTHGLGCNTISSGTTVTAAPPYLNIGGTKYVAATGFQATLPSTSPTWINSVTPTSTANGANGDFIVTTGSNAVKATTSATTSVELVCVPSGIISTSTSNNSGCSAWLWDSTNSFVYELGIQYNQSAGMQMGVFKSSWNGGAQNPSFVSTSAGIFNTYPFGIPVHLKVSISGSTITCAISLNGGVTYSTVATIGSIGTVTKGGYGVNNNSVTDIYSFNAI